MALSSSIRCSCQAGSTDIIALIHHGDQVPPIEARLPRFLSDLLAEAARAGQARSDVAASELAHYCLHALGAAAASRAARQCVVGLMLAGMDAGFEPRR
ncbi:MAG TPA: hypothetical protein VNF71_10110 [Acidimicrobiales bacterium]|nr:hypothetical protein [Acidimicrobiales bacterium]